MSTAAQARAAILQRLQSAPTFHPSSADLFADWGNQPGDIVTLRSGDNSYSMPIYGMRTRWAGSTRVEVTATGNKKRAGIAEASKKEYSRRGGGYYGQQFLHREFVSEDGTLRSLLEMTASYLRTEFADDVNGLRSNLEMTASYLRTEFNQSADGLHSEIVQTASYIRTTMDADKAGLHSEIVQTASYWRAAFEDETNSIRSLVEQTASSWRASIEGVVGSDGRITAATIAVAINAQGSSALIAADRVQISGNTTLSGALTVDGDGKLCVSRVVAIGSGYLTTINGDKVTTKDVQINSGGKLIFVGSGTGEHYDVDVATLKNCIKSASVENNVLTLTPFYGDPITFSKAVTLSGAWGSGDDAEKFIVTASSGATYKFAPPLRLNGTTQASNFSAEITDSSNPPVAKKKIYGYLVSGGSTSGSYIDVNTKNDGTGTSVARISVGALYTSGYNAGNSAGQLTGWSEAYQKVSWAGANTSSASMTIKAPAATKATNPNQQSVTYTLSTDNNVAYIKQGAVVVAKLTHNKYSTGYTYGKIDGMAAVSISSVSRSGATVTATASNGATGTLSLTSHSNCKANVTGVKISGNWLHDVLYYKDGNTYKNVTSSARYWYYSTTYGDPTTYYD